MFNYQDLQVLACVRHVIAFSVWNAVFFTSLSLTQGSSQDFTTLESEFTLFLFLLPFLSFFFLEEAEDFFLTSLSSRLSTLV